MEIALLALIAEGTDLSLGAAMLREWYLMAPLVLVSIAVTVIGVERFLFMNKAAEQSKALFEQVTSMAQSGGKAQEIVALSENAFSGSLYKALYEGPFHPQATAAAVERSRANEVALCKKSLWFVGTMGNLAPFFGLFGTVIGIIQAFMQMAKTGGGGLQTVGPGIATALITTAAGIFVGIIAVFIFNLLNVKAGKIGHDLKNFGEQVYEQRLIRLAQAAKAPIRRAGDVGQAAHSEGAAAS